jgi:O-antigen ligase
MKKEINFKKSIKIIFCIYPIIMLLPSGYITSYVTFLILFSLYYFYRSKIIIKLFFLDYLLLIFFLISFFSTLVNFKSDYIILLKSLLNIRFALLFIIIRNLFINNIINLKKLFLITLSCTIFLSFDIFLQHILGYDIMGYKPFDGRYNGVFDKEAIAGSYIQKFSIISILSIIFLNISKKYKIIFLFLLINILGLGILFSLDRMPFIIYFLILSLGIFLIKNFKYLFAVSSIILFIFFLLLFNSNSKIKYRYETLQNEINFIRIFNLISDKKDIGLSANPTLDELKYYEESVNKKNFLKGDYFKIYYSGYIVFRENIFLGSGSKSFNDQCHKLLKINNNLKCSTHPHNIYIELLVNTGIIGLFIFLIFIIKIFITNLKIIYSIRENNSKVLAIFFMIILITELMPFRSYGSIFQTVNGSIFWYLLCLASTIDLIKHNDNRINNNSYRSSKTILF